MSISCVCVLYWARLTRALDKILEHVYVVSQQTFDCQIAFALTNLSFPTNKSIRSIEQSYAQGQEGCSSVER